MKIGISFYGIMKGSRCRDWQRSSESFKRFAIDSWKNQGHEVYVYITTYSNISDDEKSKIFDFYQPTKIHFLEYDNSNRISSFIKSLKILQEEDLDLIISSRSDMVYQFPLTELNINFDKINFLFREKDCWYDYNYTCDNLFIFPGNKLNHMIDAAVNFKNNNWRKDFDVLHNYLKFVNKNEVNFISDDFYYSDTNLFYHLDRYDFDINWKEDGTVIVSVKKPSSVIEIEISNNNNIVYQCFFEQDTFNSFWCKSKYYSNDVKIYSIGLDKEISSNKVLVFQEQRKIN
jgi:hypothetical protein